MVVTELPMTTEERLLQALNALDPILVTELGIVIDWRLIHPRNTASLMVFTELPIITDTRLSQSLNAEEPILITEFGIVIDLRLSHPLKAKE